MPTICDCGAVKGDFCAECNVSKCSSCYEDFYLNSACACANCGIQETKKINCPECSKVPGFYITMGRAFGITHNSPNGNPTARPLSCTICDDKGELLVPVGRGFSSVNQRNEIYQLILNYRDLTKERQKKLAIDNLEHEKQKKSDEVAKQTAQKLKEEALKKDCEFEKKVIQKNIEALIANGNELVIKRYNHPGENRKLLEQLNLDFGFSISEDLFTNEPLGLFSTNEDLDTDASSSGRFYCMEETRNEYRRLIPTNVKPFFDSLVSSNLKDIEETFRKCIELYPPDQDNNPESLFQKLAKKYAEISVSEDLSPIQRTSITLGPKTVNYHYKRTDISPIGEHRYSYKLNYYDCTTTGVSFGQIIAIRNKVWKESWWRRTFHKIEPDCNVLGDELNKKITAIDVALQKKWSAQIKFMSEYLKQLLQTDYRPPADYENYPKDLQRKKAELEYYKALQNSDSPMLWREKINHLSFEEIERNILFKRFSGKYVPLTKENNRYDDSQPPTACKPT